MTKVSFSEMSLTPNVGRAVSQMGFDFATPIQSEAIPVIRSGVDVIARSQTGTGKTLAYAIPAIERVDTHEEKASIQVLILCPTRELALQADQEIRKIARFNESNMTSLFELFQMMTLNFEEISPAVSFPPLCCIIISFLMGTDNAAKVSFRPIFPPVKLSKCIGRLSSH